MRLTRANRFKQDYKKLPPHIRKQTDRKLQYLASNITHPSLRIKRVQKYADVFEGSITKNYRFLFQITGASYTLLRIGTHDILNKKLLK